MLGAVIAVIGACGMLQEKNEGALASTYSSLYAFFDTQTTGSVGCFPDQNSNTYAPDFTLRAMYAFQIERPKTLVVCIKNTTTYDNTNSNINGSMTMYNYQIGLLLAHTVSRFAS